MKLLIHIVCLLFFCVDESEDALVTKRKEPSSSASATAATTETEAEYPRLLDGTHFSVISNENRNVVAKCSHCKSKLSGKLPSTGNFFRHIKLMHAGLLTTIQHYSQQTPKSSKMQAVKQPKLDFRKAKNMNVSFFQNG